MGNIHNLRRSAMQQIPARQDNIVQQLQELREKINAAGVGATPELEDQYLKLLYSHRSLAQSYALRERSLPPETTSLDAGLMKSIAFGEMLLEIYGGGSLVKSASADLERYADLLMQSSDRYAIELGEKLRKLIPNHGF